MSLFYALGCIVLGESSIGGIPANVDVTMATLVKVNKTIILFVKLLFYRKEDYND